MKLGVFLHGFAGDRVAAEQREIGLIASDIIDAPASGIDAPSSRDLPRLEISAKYTSCAYGGAV